MKVHVTAVDWATHGERLSKIRGEVFIEEQGVPQDIEWDGLDPESDHFIAITEMGETVGCARLLPDGQIGRMAVLKSHRGHHIGRQLLDAAVEHACSRGLDEVHLHAQTSAEGFYRRAGFLPVGERFMEAGIEHQAMRLVLPVPFDGDPVVDVSPALVESESDYRRELAEPVRFDTDDAARDALLMLIQSARRRVNLVSPNLDHNLFDQDSVVQALSAFARQGAVSEVNVVISDTRAILARGHQLIELARRLDSSFHIRKLADPLSETWMTIDDCGSWLLLDLDTYAGEANVWHPVQAARMDDAFRQLWERAHADPELRLLKL